MRDPQHDPDEAATEETREFFRLFVKDRRWRADNPPWEFTELDDEVMLSNMPEWAQLEIIDVISAAMERRPPGKPTLHYRDSILAEAARRLAERGYQRSLGEATRDKHPDRHSQCSIIEMALRLLGVTLGEKQIKDILREHDKREKLDAQLPRYLGDGVTRIS